MNINKARYILTTFCLWTIAILTIKFVYLSVVKSDLTTWVFGKISIPAQDPVIEKTMTSEQYAEMLRMSQQGQIRQSQEPANAIIQQPAQPDKSAAGSIYRYEDDKGTVVMTSDLEKVPTRYRANMKVLDGSPHDDQQRTTVIVKDHRVYVPVIICYQGKTIKVNLILDTGATGITISPAIAQRLEIKSNDTRQGISIIANGTRVANYSVIADYVTVGPKIKREIELQILPRNGNEEEGLLGMSFLGDFPHMIDTKAQVIKWM